MGYQIVTCPMTSHNPQRCCEPVRLAIVATAWLLVEILPQLYDATCYRYFTLRRETKWRYR